jgi:hypothetical protein
VKVVELQSSLLQPLVVPVVLLVGLLSREWQTRAPETSPLPLPLLLQCSKWLLLKRLEPQLLLLVVAEVELLRWVSLPVCFQIVRP